MCKVRIKTITGKILHITVKKFTGDMLKATKMFGDFSQTSKIADLYSTKFKLVPIKVELVRD